MTEHDVFEWLKERRTKCLQLAAVKTGHDRAGWYEDAAYYEAAIMLILGFTPQDVHETRLPRKGE